MPKGWLIHPRQVDDWLGKAYRQMADEDYEGTINTCKRSLRFAPKGTHQRATALHYLGIAHLMLQHLDEAYQALSEALAITPDDADLLYNRGLAARFTSRQGQSVRDFERALSLEREPSRVSKIAEELQFARRLAEHDMALRGPDFTLDQFIEQEELYHSGVELLTAEQWEQAEQTFRAVIAMGDCLPQPWNNLGMCLMMQRRYDEAEAALRRALEINSNYENAQRNLVLLPEIRRTGILPGHTITGPFDGHDLRKSIDFPE
jgi:tetratricopeptide (TPR) repeat protein